MKGFLILLFFIVFAIRAEACKIETFPTIVFLSEESNLLSVIKNSDCDSSERQSFVQTLSGMNGTVKAEHLSAAIGKEIEITPATINVSNIRSLVKEKLQLSFNISIEKFKLIGVEKHLLLEYGDFINIECDKCDGPGNKNVKITVANPHSGLDKTYWGTAKLMKSILVLKAKEQIPTFQNSININMFDNELTSVENPDLYFTNLEQLRFYRLNRPIAKGGYLKSSDMIPVNIINAGTEAKVIIKQDGLVLEGVGVAKNSAGFGQSVELYNQKTKKRMNGKAVDLNTVQIEI